MSASKVLQGGTLGPPACGSLRCPGTIAAAGGDFGPLVFFAHYASAGEGEEFGPTHFPMTISGVGQGGELVFILFLAHWRVGVPALQECPRHYHPYLGHPPLRRGIGDNPQMTYVWSPGRISSSGARPETLHTTPPRTNRSMWTLH